MRLFHPRIIEQALSAEAITPTDRQAEIMAAWAKSIEGKVFERETSHDGEFIQRILIEVLGYTGSGAGGDYTVAKNIPLKPKGNVDVALGRFTKGTQDEVLVPFELKGAKTKDLDAVMTGRHKSPVEQAWEYAAKVRGAQWVLVSNYVEIRLYAVSYGQQYYETFDLAKLTNPAEFARLYLLLSASSLLGNRTQALLKESEQAGKEITNRLYKDYKKLRGDLIETLTTDNPKISRADIIQHAQTILDRILFIAFAEDKGLLAANTLADAYAHKDPYNPKPVWDNFKGLFRAIDKGSPDLGIPRYNGGLFEEDTALESLLLSNALCEGFKKLGDYDFNSEVSVTVLGHIFEQSISDLEELHAAAQGVVKEGAGKRKKEGVVYTPDPITRFIVEETLGRYLQEQFENLKREHGVTEGSSDQVHKNKKKAIKFWEAYQNILRSTKVIDPACGSGAFLVAAFDHLNLEYKLANSALAELRGNADLFDLDKEILSQNLYGVDINPESIEITKLSLWLKTARRGKVLNSLDDNLRVGDSLIEDSNYSYRSFAWKDAFPDIMAAGGFDVVLGNPPYVRMEFLKHLKPYLETRYEVVSDRADLYCYFYELGLRLLKAGGKLGFISSSTFFKTGSGKPLRAHITANASIEKIVDFGDLQVFEGVTTYPVIMILAKGAPPEAHNAEYLKVEKLPEGDISREFADNAQPVAQTTLTAESWAMDADGESSLTKKLYAGNKTLKEVYGAPLYGIKTGYNEAFVITRATRDRLIAEDSKSSELLLPFLEGKDIKPWHTEPRDLWIIYIPKNQVDIEKYPAIKNYMLPFKGALEKRATKQEWFELQQAQFAYSDFMRQPKIIYGHFSPEPLFSYEHHGYFSNDKSYIIPNADYFLLGILNSSLCWHLIKKLCPAVRGGFYELRVQYIETLPIPTTTAKQKTTIAALAEKCQATAGGRYTVQENVRRRIYDLRPADSTTKLTTKLAEWWELDFAAFRKEVKKSFKTDIPLAERTAWETYLADQKTIVQQHTATITQLEAELNAEVCKAYGLSAKMVDILEKAGGR